MAVLAGLYNVEQTGNKAAQVVSVLCLFLFNTWFSIGWLGMTWYVALRIPRHLSLACTDAQALPCRSHAFAYQSPGQRPVYCFQLDLELLRGHGYRTDVCEYQMGHLRRVRMCQRSDHLPLRLVSCDSGKRQWRIVLTSSLFFPETKKYSLEEVRRM